jgi:hypothetical protein
VLVGDDKYDQEAAEALVAKWHKLAAELDYIGSVAWRVKAGFTLKEHAPKAGPCYNNFGYLRGWELKNDEPTQESLVFFIPSLVAGSKSKNVKEQMALLSDLRQRFNLPAHHLASFGSATLLAGFILEYFKRVDYRIPFSDWTRTDTLHSDGRRLNLNWHGGELDCGDWGWGDGYCSSSLGCFALGVEVLGS